MRLFDRTNYKDPMSRMDDDWPSMSLSWRGIGFGFLKTCSWTLHCYKSFRRG